ncbi:MAG: DUF4169 family protein [Pseudomonadota bacterium]
MSDRPINLNKVRKDRSRAAAKRQAEANSAKFGRTRAERTADAEKTDRLRRHLDGSRRNDSDPST